MSQIHVRQLARRAVMASQQLDQVLLIAGKNRADHTEQPCKQSERHCPERNHAGLLQWFCCTDGMLRCRSDLGGHRFCLGFKASEQF